MSENLLLPMRLSGPRLELHLAIYNQHSKKFSSIVKVQKYFMPGAFRNVMQRSFNNDPQNEQMHPYETINVREEECTIPPMGQPFARSFRWTHHSKALDYTLGSSTSFAHQTAFWLAKMWWLLTHFSP